MDLEQKEWWEQAQSDANGVILDIRTEEEIEETGRIPKAKNYDFYGGAEFLEQIKALDASKNYYVYCRSGGRSSQACLVMNQLGFENTYNLLGGMNEWEGPTE